ncbi:nephrin-like isoform X2 [Amphibalanus amphitrite]|uniref:nephrin-like isoform X2 n=1 Tax=Amphibalanus amphitrite TaxID=1232801 RepID=UPI001C923CFA|nr:nephrin-like isoform X2 [Amphibalanus amphitrite]
MQPPAVHAFVLWMVVVSVHCQQQRFRVRPSNVSVVEGDSAILRCEVQHQVGQLQWAKDGFALGYSRSLPGYDRYRMLGDPGSGVHDLEITNVTLEDDGRFQCQVSPNRGQDAIRADAILTVLVKPTSVTASSTSRSPRLGLYEVGQGSQLTLRCDVTGARPAAQVQWQRNGVPVQLDQEDSFSGWGHPGRNDTTSVVTLRPTAADDGAGISCVAHHPAIAPEDRKFFNSTVQLSVLYPPGAPEISGYTEGEVVSIGQQKTLTCISRGGNPPAQLVWLKNGRPIGSKYRALPGHTLAEHRLRADVSDLGAVYSCQASSHVQPEPLTASVRTMVNFGPDLVTIEGTREARGGDLVRLTCVTSSSSPAANITWVINDRTMENTSQETSVAGDGGWISSSNISTVVPIGMRQDMTVACYGLNPALGRTKVGSAKITVLHPPEPPTILGYESGSHLRAGERVSLSCVSQGGNPPATLTWYRGDTELASSTEVRDSVARSVVTFQVDHADNGRVYTCRSTNSAEGKQQTVSTTLNVFFPPSSLKLEVRPDVLRAGSQALLTCESRPSYPEAELTWWRDNVQVTDGVTTLETFKAGKHGGSSSRLQLRRNLTWTDDGAAYSCRAHVAPLRGIVEDRLILDVSYAPVFSKSLFSEEFVVDSSHVLNLTARARPAGVRYHWTRESPGGGPVPAEGPVLRLDSVSRTDAGWYHLEASNELGITTVRVHINVLYPPQIVSVSGVSMVSTGEDAVLECSADANPAAPGMISWHREGFNLASDRVSTFTRNGTSYLTVHNATKEDIGEFLCRADNGVGQATATAALLVKHGPEMDERPQFRRAAAAAGRTARLPCRAAGVPNVTFQWSKAGVLIDGTIHQKYRLAQSQLDLQTWQSVLRIKDVQSSDYATYECVALNELGSQRQQIELGRPSAPDPPLGLKVVNVSHDSATVAWEAGFDGGQKQMYRVRLTEGSDRHQYRDVQPLNTTIFTVTGLQASTAYMASVMAYSRLGDSAYSQPVRLQTAAGPPPVSYVTDRDEPGGPAAFPRVAVISVTAVGALLLILNVIFIGCYRRRRHLKKQKAATSEASTKSETLHMYGNETVSSMSVKSGESYPREDSMDDYDASRHCYDPYAGGSVSETAVEYTNHLRSPSRAADFGHDQYVEALRRNSYTYTAGSSVETAGNHFTTYTTQPPRAPQFRTSALDAPTPDLLHSSGPGSGYFPPEPPAGPGRHYSTLPHQRRAAAATAAAPLSSFNRQCSRLASPPPTVITDKAPLEQRGHLV